MAREIRQAGSRRGMAWAAGPGQSTDVSRRCSRELAMTLGMANRPQTHPQPPQPLPPPHPTARRWVEPRCGECQGRRRGGGEYEGRGCCGVACVHAAHAHDTSRGRRRPHAAVSQSCDGVHSLTHAAPTPIVHLGPARPGPARPGPCRGYVTLSGSAGHVRGRVSKPATGVTALFMPWYAC